MLEVAEGEQLPVSQARAGDPAAWDALFRRYQLPLYAYVFELLGEPTRIACASILLEVILSASG